MGFLFDLVSPLQGQRCDRLADFRRKNGAAFDDHFGHRGKGCGLTKNHPAKHGIATVRGVQAGVVDQVDEKLGRCRIERSAARHGHGVLRVRQTGRGHRFQRDARVSGRLFDVVRAIEHKTAALHHKVG